MADDFTDYFAGQVAIDPNTGDIVKGAEITIYAADDLTHATPLALTSPTSGATIEHLTTSADLGTYPDFAVEGSPQSVLAVSGSYTSKLLSMKGRQGDPGKTAYEYAQDAGYAGTEQEFADKLASDTVSEEQLTDAVESYMTDNPPTSSWGNVSGDITEQADLQTALDERAPVNKQIIDPTNGQFASVEIVDDGSSTAGWKNRFQFLFKKVGAAASDLVSYINEYGEFRVVPAKKNTVGLRVFMAKDDADLAARSDTTPAFEVADKRSGTRTSKFGVYTNATRINGYLVTTGPAVPDNPEAGQLHILTEV